MQLGGEAGSHLPDGEASACLAVQSLPAWQYSPSLAVHLVGRSIVPYSSTNRGSEGKHL